jgi:hypothetical protein
MRPIQRSAMHLTIAAATVFGGACEASAQTQYKRIGLEGVTEVVMGNPDKAIERFTKHLESNPDDAESQFGLAVAYAATGDISAGVAAARAAIDSGLPVERFVAGPRPLIEPLRQDPSFAELIAESERGLVGGPMLGNLTDHSVDVWMRLGAASDRAFVRITGKDHERTLARWHAGTLARWHAGMLACGMWQCQCQCCHRFCGKGSDRRTSPSAGLSLRNPAER